MTIETALRPSGASAAVADAWNPRSKAPAIAGSGVGFGAILALQEPVEAAVPAATEKAVEVQASFVQDTGMLFPVANGFSPRIAGSSQLECTLTRQFGNGLNSLGTLDADALTERGDGNRLSANEPLEVLVTPTASTTDFNGAPMPNTMDSAAFLAAFSLQPLAPTATNQSNGGQGGDIRAEHRVTPEGELPNLKVKPEDIAEITAGPVGTVSEAVVRFKNTQRDYVEKSEVTTPVSAMVGTVVAEAIVRAETPTRVVVQKPEVTSPISAMAGTSAAEAIARFESPQRVATEKPEITTPVSVMAAMPMVETIARFESPQRVVAEKPEITAPVPVLVSTLAESSVAKGAVQSEKPQSNAVLRTEGLIAVSGVVIGGPVDTVGKFGRLQPDTAGRSDGALVNPIIAVESAVDAGGKSAELQREGSAKLALAGGASAASVATPSQPEGRSLSTSEKVVDRAFTPVAEPSTVVNAVVPLRREDQPRERAILRTSASDSVASGQPLLSSAGSTPVQFTADLQVPAEVFVAEKVAYWIANDVQNAELKLDGMGLNPVEVSIRMHGNEAHVAFRTDELQTRTALESAGAHLKELLQREGLVLTGVSIGSAGAGDSGGRQGSPRQGERQPPTTAAAPVRIERGAVAGRIAGGTLDLFV